MNICENNEQLAPRPFTSSINEQIDISPEHEDSLESKIGRLTWRERKPRITFRMFREKTESYTHRSIHVDYKIQSTCCQKRSWDDDIRDFCAVLRSRYRRLGHFVEYDNLRRTEVGSFFFVFSGILKNFDARCRLFCSSVDISQFFGSQLLLELAK